MVACVNDAPSALCNAVDFEWVACDGAFWLAVWSRFVPYKSGEGSHGLGLQRSAYGLWALLVVVKFMLSLLEPILKFFLGRGDVGIAIILDMFGKSGYVQGVVNVVLGKAVVQVGLEIIVVAYVGTYCVVGLGVELPVNGHEALFVIVGEVARQVRVDVFVVE